MLVVLKYMSVDDGVPSVMISGGSTMLMLLAGKWDLMVPIAVFGHSGVVDPFLSPSGWTMSPVQEVNPN